MPAPTKSPTVAIQLHPATAAKLRAIAETMGVSADALGERIIVEMLPTVQHEDLLDVQDPQQGPQEAL
ncbi:MAG TPA: hypothetical protein VJZ73_13330 [Methylomirabilota bacterium]|nr:hypothetical protein [Methylomirabilota bacterium]